MTRLTTILAATFLLTSSALAEEARIYPERLLAGTPQAASEIFVERFAAQDYFAVFYLLSAEARLDFFKVFQATFGFEHVFVGTDGAIPPGSIMAPGTDVPDHVLADRSLTFDDLFLKADAAGMLPFTFAEDAEIGAVKESTSQAQVQVATQREPAEVTLHLVSDDGGAWLVDRITWDGSGEDYRPWSRASAL